MRYDAEIPAVIHAVFSELGDRRVHHPAQQPQAAARLLRRPGHRRRRAAGAGAARGRQARQARRRRGARDAGGRGLRPGAGRRSTRLMAFVAGALDRRTPMRWRSSTRWARATPLFERRPRRTARGAASWCSALGVPESRLRAQPLDRARPGLLHRHRLRDHARRAPADRLDLLGRPLRQPRQPLHQVEAAGRRHLDRPDAPVLPVARGRAGVDAPTARCEVLVDADGRRAAAAMRWRCRSELRAAGINAEAQLEPRKLAKQFQYADRAGIRFVVLRRRGRDRARRGGGQGPAPRRPVRSRASRTGADACGSSCEQAGAAGAATMKPDPPRWPLADARAAGRGRARRHGRTRRRRS